MALKQSSWEERFPFYDDIEQLISPGFLSSVVRVSSTLVLKLRSLNSSDYRRVYYRSEIGSLRDWKAWVIAESVWMINSDFILGKEKFLKPLFKTIRKLSNLPLNLLYLACTELTERTTIAIKGVQAYSFEAVSRQKWLFTTPHSPNEEVLTGFKGTSSLGLNLVQQLWVCFNQIEDRRLQDFQEWARLRQTMSPHLQKSSWEHLVQHDKNAISKIEVQRQEILDLFYYRATKVLEWDADFDSTNYQSVLKKKSTQDLATEYRAWTSEELDDHDLIVEQIKEKMRRSWLDYHAEQERLKVERSKIIQDNPAITSRTEMVGMTLEQLRVSNPKAVTKHTIVNLYEEDHSAQSRLFENHLSDRDKNESLNDAVKNRRLVVDE